MGNSPYEALRSYIKKWILIKKEKYEYFII
jgi:hypothetical protein